MTVTVSDNIADVTGGTDARPWKVWSPVVREGETGVVSLRQRTVDVTDGRFTVELDPGLAVIESPDGQKWTVTVPDGSTTLRELLTSEVPTSDSEQALIDAVAAYLDRRGHSVVPDTFGLGWVAVSTGYSAGVGEMIDADATNGGFTIMLPEEPPDLTVVSVRKRDATSNPVLVQRTGGDVFSGGDSVAQLSLPGESVTWQYHSGVWRPVTHNQTRPGLDQLYHLKKAVPGSPSDIRILDANGAAAIEINSTANAINYLRVTNGATGNRVNLRVGGRDSQIHLGLRPKGSSSAVQIMDSNGVLVAHFITGSGTPVNYFMFQSSATAEAVPISAIGSDSVISINVVPKGTTGTLQVNGNAIANRSGELITSQINDTNGNGAIFITATASAVNYAQITNAAAGGTVHFRVTGASSNIPLALRAKGTSAVQILDPSLNLIASFLPGTTPVNSWLFYSAGSGTAVEAQAIGSDTDVSISLKPKGVGTVNVTTGITVSGTSAVWKSGSGSPEGVVTAPVGSLWTRTNGGASTTLYVKESGSGNTGWKAVQTA